MKRPVNWYKISLLVLVLLVLAAGLGGFSPVAQAAQGSPPQIVAVDFPAKIQADGKFVTGDLLFKEPDGDLNQVKFDLLTGDKSELQISPGWQFDPQVSGQSQGVIEFQIAASAGGQFQIQVTLADQAGNVSQPEKFSFEAIGAPAPAKPLARFSASPAQGDAPLTVRFSNQSENYDSSLWDFGDGSQSTATSPTHTYQGAKRYVVALTVKGPGGQDRATAIITVNESKPSARCGETLYEDDFGDPSSGWTVGSFQGFDWSYSGSGEYRVISASPNSIAWSWAPTKRTFSDFCLEVRVKQVVAGSLSSQGAMGIIFAGNQRARSFTRFAISPAFNAYTVDSFSFPLGGSTSQSTQVNWTNSSAIKPVNSWNDLLIIAQGGQVSFYANGVLLIKVGLGSTGSVGVFSATFDQPNTNAHFDDFKVSRVR